MRRRNNAMHPLRKPDNTGARQRNKITPEEREMVRRYLEGLKQEQARIERAMQEEVEAAREPQLWGYVRCSHEDSKASGRGEDAQCGSIKREAEYVRGTHPELSDIEWAQEQDPVSAYKVPLRQRPAGREMNRQLRQGDHVVFAYLDRVFRDTEDCLTTLKDWKKRGVTPHFADVRIDMNSAMGEMLITILAACARMESAMKSERIKGTFVEMAKEGRKSNGHAPMGYKLVGQKGTRRKMIMDWDARRIMGEIVRVRDTYHWPWRKISDYVEQWLAEKFNRKPTPPWERRKWHFQHCARAYTAEIELRKNGHAASAG
jgi:DNA invertase Pin-like site-specific DNA recombinase